MDYTVYFADKAVVFTAKTPGEGWYAVTPAPDGGISRAKVTKILESYNKAAVVTPDPGAAFGAFAAEFALIEAAGGVVVNDCGQWLMIRRNGRWDLPKGHLECGERIEECAAREIEEETGVRAGVVRPLCDTLHAYYFPKTERWELKRTHWYELHTASCARLVPQAEEGIEQVVWCTPAEVTRNLRDAFPTIRCVVAAVGKERGWGDAGSFRPSFLAGVTGVFPRPPPWLSLRSLPLTFPRSFP